jgi:hypothetical protein
LAGSPDALNAVGVILAIAIPALLLGIVVQNRKRLDRGLRYVVIRLKLHFLSQRRSYWAYQNLADSARDFFAAWFEAVYLGKNLRKAECMSAKVLEEIQQAKLAAATPSSDPKNFCDVKITNCEIVKIKADWPYSETFEAIIHAKAHAGEDWLFATTSCLFTFRENSWWLIDVYEMHKGSKETAPSYVDYMNRRNQ